MVALRSAQYSQLPSGPGPMWSNSSASSSSRQGGGSQAIARGVNLQLRRRASATVVPPQEQDSGVVVVGERVVRDQLARKTRAQAAARSGIDLERKMVRRWRGRRLEAL